MEKFMTHQELKVMLLKDPAFRAAYEAVQFPFSALWLIRRGSIHRGLSWKNS
ncbi:hypothetical protein K5Y91_004674 [Escherichia coli]|nr:hypothetical protein [Escherichia coli]